MMDFKLCPDYTHNATHLKYSKIAVCWVRCQIKNIPLYVNSG